MADLRQRSIAEDLKNKEMRKAQSILIYGEQRYEYAKDVPYAPRGYVYAAMMLLAGQVAAVPFVASIPSM